MRVPSLYHLQALAAGTSHYQLALAVVSSRPDRSLVCKLTSDPLVALKEQPPGLDMGLATILVA